MDIESRIFNIETDLRSLHDRMGKVEDKAASAWNSIRETKEDLGDLYDKVEELEKDVKDMKVTQDKLNSNIRWLVRIVGILAAVVLFAGIIAWRNGSDVPEKVVEAVVPLLQNLPK